MGLVVYGPRHYGCGCDYCYGCSYGFGCDYGHCCGCDHRYYYHYH